MQYSRVQIILIFLGLVVIVGFSFVLGLMWGHHLASSSFEKLLPKEKELTEELSSKRKNLTFYEAIRKEGVKEGASRDSTKKAPPSRASAGKGVYKLQVASFLGKRRADELMGKLVRKGFKTKVVLAKGKAGKLWHKVQVIGIPGRKKAESLSRKIKKSFGIKSLLVKVR